MTDSNEAAEEDEQQESGALPEKLPDDFLSKLPEDLRSALSKDQLVALQKAVSVEVRSEWSGPLPRPQDLKTFGEVLSSAPERILQMTEDVTAHLIRVGDGNTRRSQMIVHYSALTVVGCLLLGAYMAHLGYDWTAVLTGVGPVLVGLLLSVLRRRISDSGSK